MLDVLVNDVWGGDPLTEWKPLWDHDLERGLRLLRLALDTHIITSHYALPLLIRRRRGLVVEVTDGDEETNAVFPDQYRGGFFYDVVKKTVIQLARTQAAELRAHEVFQKDVVPRLAEIITSLRQ